MFFLINSGKLFYRVGPTNKIAVCPMFVLQKDILSFANFFLCVYSTMWSKFKNFFQIVITSVLTNFNVSMFIHWSTLLLLGNQFINLKSSSDMWCISSSLGQNLTHLFCMIWISFFVFFFFSKIRVPCVIKMCLNKCIAEHSLKFWA